MSDFHSSTIALDAHMCIPDVLQNSAIQGDLPTTFDSPVLRQEEVCCSLKIAPAHHNNGLTFGSQPDSNSEIGHMECATNQDHSPPSIRVLPVANGPLSLSPHSDNEGVFKEVGPKLYGMSI